MTDPITNEREAILEMKAALRLIVAYGRHDFRADRDGCALCVALNVLARVDVAETAEIL